MTRDPEVKEFGDNKKAELGIALSRKFKNKEGEIVEKTTFVDVDVWGRQAEIVEKYVKKGNLIGVENGELELDTWENEAGEKRSKLRVKAGPSSIRLFPKSTQGGDGEQAPAKSAAPAKAAESSEDDENLF